MSFLMLEGFGGYEVASHSDAAGADPHLQGWNGWSGNMEITALDSQSDGVRNYLTLSEAGSLNSRVFTGQSTIFGGFRFWHDGGQAGGSMIMYFVDGTSRMGMLGISPTNRLVYVTTSTGYVPSGVVAFADRAVPIKQWVYVEYEVTFGNGTSGAVKLYMNGQEVANVSSIDTINVGAGSCDSIEIGHGLYDAQTRFADFYIDSAEIHGEMEIWYQKADTAGSASNWTPAASTNESQVDDLGSDGDATYNQSTATGTKDQIAHGQTLGAAPLCVNPMVMARLETSAENIQVGILSDPGGTPTEDLDSAVAVPSTSYEGVVGKFYVLDPDTGSAWTAANADAAETVYNHAA